MKLFIAFALATSGSAALAQAQDQATHTAALAPETREPAAKSCPMMDDGHKAQQGGASGGKPMPGMAGKKGMGGNAASMHESCPMMAKGPKAGAPDPKKGTPEKDSDHADH